MQNIFMQNINKLVNMLSAESIKAMDSDNLNDVEYIYFEVERYLKTHHEKLKSHRESLYLAKLEGKEEGQINGYTVTYRPTQRFAQDNTKLRDYFKEITDDQYKNLFYSQSFTKPKLIFKTIK
jgi:predicted phage-related endonuclease